MFYDMILLVDEQVSPLIYIFFNGCGSMIAVPPMQEADNNVIK